LRVQHLHPHWSLSRHLSARLTVCGVQRGTDSRVDGSVCEFADDGRAQDTVVDVCVCAPSGTGEAFGEGCCECGCGCGRRDGGALVRVGTHAFAGVSTHGVVSVVEVRLFHGSMRRVDLFFPSSGGRYVQGQRAVILRHTSKARRHTLQVLDFNVHRAFDDDDTGHDDGDTGDVVYHADEGKKGNEDEDEDMSLRKAILERVDYPTYVYMPNVFVDSVGSGLPYREARRDVRGDYSGVMIDDERLVALQVRVDSSSLSVTVTLTT
jgi:hypothetical protein